MRFFLDKHIVFTVIAIANLAAVGLFWLLALLGLKQLQQTALSTSLFEKIPFIIELKPEVKAAEGLILQNWIAAHQWVKPETVQFIAKTEGLKQLQSQLGSPQLSKSGDLADSSLVFETNPLPDIIQFSMKAEYFALQKQLMDSLLTKPELQSVYTAEQIQPNVDKELNRAAKWFVVSKLWWWFLFVFCSFLSVLIYGLCFLLLIIKDKNRLETYSIYAVPQNLIIETYHKLSLKFSGIAALLLLLLIWASQLLQSEPFFEINQPYSYAVLYLLMLLILPLLVWFSLKAVIYLYVNKYFSY